MAKIVVVDYCDECLYFDSGYDHEKAECKKLGGKTLIERIKYDYYYRNVIPDDCPLPNAPQSIAKNDADLAKLLGPDFLAKQGYKLPNTNND